MKNRSGHFSSYDLAGFKLIAWYQILGGTIGVLLYPWLLIDNRTWQTGLVVLLGLLPNGYSIYAGQQLRKHTQFKPPYLIQTLQVLNFVGLGITYQLVIGLALGPGFEWIQEPKMVMNFSLLSEYNFGMNQRGTASIRVVVNFIPIGIIQYLLIRQQNAAERQQLREYAENGGSRG